MAADLTTAMIHHAITDAQVGSITELYIVTLKISNFLSDLSLGMHWANQGNIVCHGRLPQACNSESSRADAPLKIWHASSELAYIRVLERAGRP